MENASLGLIEVQGLVGAIEAADAGSKAANVTFHGYQRGLAGLITVVFTGDVAAVRAAVAAGVAAAKRVGKVVSTDVIARPDRQLRVTPDASKPVGQAVPATPELPASVTESEATVRISAQTEPSSTFRGVIEPSPEEISALRTSTAMHSAVATAEVKGPIPSPSSEASAQPWSEAATRGGNGDSPGSQTSETGEAERAERTPPAHKKEKIRRTKPRKKL